MLGAVMYGHKEFRQVIDAVIALAEDCAKEPWDLAPPAPEVEVVNGKPAPDIFIEAARRLGVAAEQCIGIEDSFAGLTAVRAAGMYTVAIATTHTVEELAMAKPDIIVADYIELLNHFA